MTNWTARVAVLAAGFLIALIGGGAAAVFLCIALYVSLCHAIGPTWAALACAGIVLLVTILLLLLFGAAARGVEEEDEEENQVGAEIGRVLGANAQGLLSKNPQYGVVFAVIAGLAVGFSPKLRSLLMKLVQG